MATGDDDAKNSRPDSQLAEKFAIFSQIQPFKEGGAPLYKTDIYIKEEMPTYEKQDRRKSPRITDKIRHSIIPTKVKKKRKYSEYISDEARKNRRSYKMVILFHSEEMNRCTERKTRCCQSNSNQNIKSNPQSPRVVIRKICRRAKSEKEPVNHHGNCICQNNHSNEICRRGITDNIISCGHSKKYLFSEPGISVLCHGSLLFPLWMFHGSMYVFS